MFIDLMINYILVYFLHREKRSLYHSLCHSSIRFVQAGMTFNQVRDIRYLKLNLVMII
jgi:hypothetical protein